MNKLPPIQKIHEAYSAIADGRVKFDGERAEVVSSDRKKRYTVTWEGDLYTSNDNASYWQGYAGYPMIAVLMLQGRLPLDRQIAGYFKGINWTELNARYKAKYDRAVAEVMGRLREEGVDTARVDEEVNRVYSALKELDISTKRSRIEVVML